MADQDNTPAVTPPVTGPPMEARPAAFVTLKKEAGESGTECR